MFRFFETVTDLAGGAAALRARRYGVVEARDGRFHRVRLRPLPRLGSVPEVMLLGGLYHRYFPGDGCLLYYNQPLRFPNFLAVKYILSSGHATWPTVHRALDVLEEIARIKRSDALLCDAANWRLSTAIMKRLGWEPHCPSRWHRHFIRRYYGDYPPRPRWLVELLGEASEAIDPLGGAATAASYSAAVAVVPDAEVTLRCVPPVATIPPDCCEALAAGAPIGVWPSAGATLIPPSSVAE